MKLVSTRSSVPVFPLMEQWIMPSSTPRLAHTGRDTNGSDLTDQYFAPEHKAYTQQTYQNVIAGD